MNIKKVKIGEENCRILSDYPDYAISNTGSIFSHYKKSRWKRLSLNRIKNNGYVIISIRDKEGNKHTFNIHQLVALAWIPNPDNKPYVGHRDNIRTNNNSNNLFWCTAKENTAQCIREGRSYKPPKKASKQELREIRKLRSENGLSYYRLSKLYGYSQVTIKKYCTND